MRHGIPHSVKLMPEQYWNECGVAAANPHFSLDDKDKMRGAKTVQGKGRAMLRHLYEPVTKDRRGHGPQGQENHESNGKSRQPPLLEINQTKERVQKEKEKRHTVGIASMEIKKKSKRNQENPKDETKLITRSTRKKKEKEEGAKNEKIRAMAVEQQDKQREQESKVTKQHVDEKNPILIILSSDEEDEEDDDEKALRRSSRGKRPTPRSPEKTKKKSNETPLWTKRILPRVESTREDVLISILTQNTPPVSLPAEITQDMSVMNEKDTLTTRAAPDRTQGSLINEKNTPTVSSVVTDTRRALMNEKITPIASSASGETQSAQINEKDTPTTQNGTLESLMDKKKKNTPTISSVSDGTHGAMMDESKTSTTNSVPQGSGENEKNTLITSSVSNDLQESQTDEMNIAATSTSQTDDTQRNLMHENNGPTISSAPDDTQTLITKKNTPTSSPVPDNAHGSLMNEKKIPKSTTVSDDPPVTQANKNLPLTSSVSKNTQVTRINEKNVPVTATKPPRGHIPNQTAGIKRKYVRDVASVSKPMELPKRPGAVRPRHSPVSLKPTASTTVPDALRSAIAQVVSQRQELLSRSQRERRSRSSSSGSDAGLSDKDHLRSRASSRKQHCSVDTAYPTRSKTGPSLGLMPPHIDKPLPTDGIVNIGRKRMFLRAKELAFDQLKWQHESELQQQELQLVRYEMEVREVLAQQELKLKRMRIRAAIIQPMIAAGASIADIAERLKLL